MAKISKEWSGLSKEELDSRLTELKKELLKLSLEVAARTNPKSAGKLKQTKKNIARILTWQRKKEV